MVFAVTTTGNGNGNSTSSAGLFLDSASRDWLPAAIAVFIVLVSLALWVHEKLVASTFRIIKALEKQGVKGAPFRPLIGNIPEFSKYESLRLAQDPSSPPFSFFPLLHQQHGPLSSLCIGPFPHLLLLDPALIRSLFVSHSNLFHKPPVMKTVLGVFGQGLVTADGPKWAAHRRLVNPAFQPSPLKRMYPTMQRLFLSHLSHLQQRVQKHPSGSGQGEGQQVHEEHEVLIDQFASASTLEIVVKAVFGSSLESEGGGQREGEGEGQEARAIDEVIDAFRGVQRAFENGFSIFTLLPLLRWLPLEKNLLRRRSEAAITRCTLQLIENRRREERERESRGEVAAEGKVHNDLLGLLMAASDDGDDATDVAAAGGAAAAGSVGSTGAQSHMGAQGGARDVGSSIQKQLRAASRLSNEELMAECNTFLIAGHETTASAFSWAMMLLGERGNEEWQERAREEVRRLMGGEAAGSATSTGIGGLPAMPEYEQLSELKLLGCIINESLRLYPPVLIVVRQCVAAVRLGNSLTVPEGVGVAVHVGALHRCKEVWGEDADEFKPLRFAEGEGGRESIPPCAFMPFTAGPRVCVGQGFAMMELKMMLAAMLMRFKWTVGRSFKLEPEFTMIHKNKGGIPLVLTPLLLNTE